jgi:hypothetical protein
MIISPFAKRHYADQTYGTDLSSSVSSPGRFGTCRSSGAVESEMEANGNQANG